MPAGGSVAGADDPLALGGPEECRREIATHETLDGQPLIKDFDFAKKVSQLEIDLAALEITELRTLAGEQAGKGPGPESSILKIKGTEIQQRLTELTLEAVGTYSAPYYGSIANDTGSNEYAVGPAHAQHAAATYFNMRKTSIYGGSNEIQRNIIGDRVLGLPREPMVDKNLPFKDLKVGTIRS